MAQEFEYKRNGTQALIAAMNIALGKVTAQCGDTRTEQDFVMFIEKTIREAPGYNVYHFVLDQKGKIWYIEINGFEGKVLIRYKKVHRFSLYSKTLLVDEPNRDMVWNIDEKSDQARQLYIQAGLEE